MKLLLDFLPIVLFFAVFKIAEGRPDEAAAFATEHFGSLVSGGTVAAAQAPVLLATLVVMLATLVQILVLLLMRRKVDKMLWISLGLVTVLGGATVWFQNETFIKWKPSVLYWVMGLVFWLSHAIWRKNLLQSVMGEQMQLPPQVWRKLNLMWIAFFAFMGLVNLYVAYSFTTDVWVNFKLFGSLGLMIAFTVAQAVYLGKHMKQAETPEQS